MKGEGGRGRAGSIIVNFCYLEVLWSSVGEGWWGGAESLIRIFVTGVTQGNEDAGSVQSLPLFSLFQEPSKIRKVMEEIFEVNANEDIDDMNLCNFTQDTSPTTEPSPKKTPPITSSILTTPQEVHSSIPPSSKEKQPPKEESNSKTITPRFTIQHPWPHNPPQPHHPPSHWNVKAPSKSQNPHTIQKMITITSRVTLTYPSNTPRPPKQTHMPSFSFPIIFPRTVAELLGIIPRKPRGITIDITF